VALRQTATRALIAESIRRCQCGHCSKHNPLPLADDAYTTVTCAACAGVRMVNTKSRKVLRGSDETPARPTPWTVDETIGSSQTSNLFFVSRS
jgi:hypothetical protein